MARLLLAGNYIENLGALGFNYGHLQVVLEQGGTLTENEVQRPNPVTIPLGGKWQYPALRDHTAAENTSNFGVAGEYASVELDLGGRRATDVWNILTQVRASFVANGADIDYDTEQNSNSYATSLLYSVGLSVDDYLLRATPAEVDRFPGEGVNVLLSEADSFSLNLRGTGRADVIVAGIMDDTLAGAGGNDSLDGAGGQDVAVFSESCANYDFVRIDATTVRVTHARGSRSDGVDLLSNIEIGRFADGDVDLTADPVRLAATDLMLLIDVSGSMGDDIASVRARSNELVSRVFGACSDSRVGIISFNDTGAIRTELNFTDQESIEARKAAALAGIQGVDIIGGGQEPAYGAILSALNGDAGTFRTETGVSRRIVVFTDEAPADPELRSQAIARAQNLGVVVEMSSVRSVAIGSQSEQMLVAAQTFALADETGDAPTPVEIFTVFIGSNASARSEYESLALETGGQVVSASDANAVVDALLEAISTPTYAIEAEALEVREGAKGEETQVVFSITRDVAASAATVTLVREGTANAADASHEEPLEIAFAAGEGLKQVVVTVKGDGRYELDETVSLRIDSVSEASSTGTGSASVVILNDDYNRIRGSDGDDVLTGLLDDDLIRGLGGDDLVRGFKGADLIHGGVGDDSLFSGRHRDEVHGGRGADVIGGRRGDDLLFGEMGRDLVRGWKGDDTLVGGHGIDTLRGGPGADVFVIDRSDRGFDRIRDFDPADDAVLLVGFGDGVGLRDIRFARGPEKTKVFVDDDLIAIVDVDQADRITRADFEFGELI